MKTTQEATSELAERYPNIAAWVFCSGWIEIGLDRRGRTIARALDEGGLAWESDRPYRSLEDVLQALDQGIADWLKKNG